MKKLFAFVLIAVLVYSARSAAFNSAFASVKDHVDIEQITEQIDLEGLAEQMTNNFDQMGTKLKMSTGSFGNQINIEMTRSGDDVEVAEPVTAPTDQFSDDLDELMGGQGKQHASEAMIGILDETEELRMLER